MNRREIATRLVIQKTVIDLLREANDIERAGAQTEFDEPGVSEPAKVGDTRIGTVLVGKGRETWKVTDPRAFLAWVTDTRPDELVQSVRESFTAAVLASCKKEGGWIDTDTGEISVPPGVARSTGDPILTVKPNEDARAAVLDALGDTAVELGLAVRAEIAS